MERNLKSLPLNQKTLKDLEDIFFDNKEDNAWRKSVLDVLQSHGYPSYIKTILDHKLIAFIGLANREKTSQLLKEDFFVNYEDWTPELPNAKKVMKELPTRLKYGAKITLNEKLIKIVDEASNTVRMKEVITEPAVSAIEYWSKGSAYEELGRWKDALVCYEKAIELGGNEYATYKASVLVRLNRKDEAIQVYKEALTQTDNFERLAYINYKLACLYIRKKDYHSSAKEFLSINSNFKAIIQTGRMDEDSIDHIRFKNGNKINTYIFANQIIRVIAELEKVPENQPWEEIQLKKAVISVANETLLELKKWIEETKQMSV